MDDFGRLQRVPDRSRQRRRTCRDEGEGRGDVVTQRLVRHHPRRRGSGRAGTRKRRGRSRPVGNRRGDLELRARPRVPPSGLLHRGRTKRRIDGEDCAGSGDRRCHRAGAREGVRGVAQGTCGEAADVRLPGNDRAAAGVPSASGRIRRSCRRGLQGTARGCSPTPSSQPPSDHSVEARHAAWMRQLFGITPAVNAFDRPASRASINRIVASTKFIVAKPKMKGTDKPKFTG